MKKNLLAPNPCLLADEYESEIRKVPQVQIVYIKRKNIGNSDFPIIHSSTYQNISVFGELPN